MRYWGVRATKVEMWQLEGWRSRGGSTLGGGGDIRVRELVPRLSTRHDDQTRHVKQVLERIGDTVLHGINKLFNKGTSQPPGFGGLGLGGKKIALRGGDGTEAHLPNPPLPLLGRRAGRGVWAGAALPAVPGEGGPTPTYMTQNDPRVALIILTEHMWGKIVSWKTFSGPKFVFRAFGGNIRLYTKQRARHGSPFLEPSGPPPPPSPGVHAISPPQSNFRAALVPLRKGGVLPLFLHRFHIKHRVKVLRNLVPPPQIFSTFPQVVLQSSARRISRWTV